MEDAGVTLEMGGVAPYRIFDIALAVFDSDVAPAIATIAANAPAVDAFVTVVGVGFSETERIEIEGESPIIRATGDRGIKNFGTTRVTGVERSIVTRSTIGAAGAGNAVIQSGDSGGPMFVDESGQNMI